MERVLAFGCHPDDVEFMCAGTLALLARKGYEIHIATMAGGEVGSPSLTTQQIREKRLAEAAQAAAVLNGHFHYAGGYDLEIEYNAAYRRMTTRVMREVDPLIVFTCPPMDYMADHEQTSLLVRNAAYIASVPLYDCGVPTTPTRRFPYLYYWNAIGLADIFGRPLPLHVGIDVTPVIDIKHEMLACHVSQREWLSFHNGWDAYTETMKGWSRAQGRAIGREHGECFIQHLGNGHPRDNILMTILPESAITMRGAGRRAGFRGTMRRMRQRAVLPGAR
jgi:N-acetylglucosamine malate deacetylase 1